MKQQKILLTEVQLKAIKAIERAIKKAQKIGVRIYGKADSLTAYPEKAWDMNLVAEQHELSSNIDVDNRIIATITDSGADDSEYYKKGVF